MIGSVAVMQEAAGEGCCVLGETNCGFGSRVGVLGEENCGFGSRAGVLGEANCGFNSAPMDAI